MIVKISVRLYLTTCPSLWEDENGTELMRHYMTRLSTCHDDKIQSMQT